MCYNLLASIDMSGQIHLLCRVWVSVAMAVSREALVPSLFGDCQDKLDVWPDVHLLRILKKFQTNVPDCEN